MSKVPDQIALDLIGNFRSKLKRLIIDTVGIMQIADIEEEQAISFAMTAMIAEVAAIAAIRTFLTFFLDRDIELEYRRTGERNARRT